MSAARKREEKFVEALAALIAAAATYVVVVLLHIEWRWVFIGHGSVVLIRGYLYFSHGGDL